MSIDEWFWSWARRHVEAIPHDHWPSLDSEFWQQLRRLFEAHGITADVADQVTATLFARKPRYPNEHPEAILAATREIRREQPTPRISRPVANDVDGEDFNRRAYAHWATLDESVRQEWLDLAAERCPPLCRQPLPHLWLAQAWALDPKSVISPEPPPVPPGKGMRHVTQPPTKKV